MNNLLIKKNLLLLYLLLTILFIGHFSAPSNHNQQNFLPSQGTGTPAGLTLIQVLSLWGGRI